MSLETAHIIPYNDKKIRAVGSIVVAYWVVMLRNSDFLEYMTTTSFYIDMLMATPSAWVLWFLLRKIHIWLDVKFGWFEGAVIKRILYQVIFGVLSISVSAVFVTYLQFEFIYEQSLIESAWLYIEFPMVVLIITLINTYYVIYYLVWKQQHSNELVNSKDIGVETLDSLIAAKGSSSVVIPIQEIKMIYKQDQINFIQTTEGDKLIFNEYSLNDIQKKLNPEEFFRSNRQSIIARSQIESYKSIENGKIQVYIKAIDSPIIISQKNASKFRSWIQ